MQTVPNDQLLQKARDQTLESDRVERTISDWDPEKFSEAICSFANDLPGRSLPGFLFIGVRDDGTVVGVKDPARLLRELGGLRSSGSIMPPPVMSVTQVASADGKPFIAVQVDPSDRPPVRFNGRVCIRVGPRRGIATPQEERQLAERSVARSLTWDMLACPDASLDDLALDLFTLQYLPQAVHRDVLAQNARSIQQQLSALRLFDLVRGCPTNGAVLLFGKDPLRFFPGAYVQYVKYAGEELASEVQAERRCDNDLTSVLKSLKQLADDLSVARPVQQPDHSDRTVFDYPPRALFELFMNSAVHRDYERSTPTTINHFSNRIEIQNPGSLYDLSPAMFRQATSYRNPVLAEAAKTLGFVNRFGRGIATVDEHLKINGSPEAQFAFDGQFFLATVQKHP